MKSLSKYEIIFVLILFVYPFRHCLWGLDLWDTGYNVVNFIHFETDSVDSMWMFATYLANFIGHVFTLLPYGDTLIGINVYTSLIISFISIITYFFFVNYIKVDNRLVFMSEMLALCLCWNPSTVLYNYLTYLFFILCIIMLYIGLKEDRVILLFCSGICLGLNVFVRFSNASQIMLIIPVWYWGFISSPNSNLKKKCQYVFRSTTYCFLGFFSSVLSMLVLLTFRYGANSYFEAIKRLLAMTETATDYKVTSMIRTVISSYDAGIKWIIMIMIFSGIAHFVIKLFNQFETFIKSSLFITMIIFMYVSGLFTFKYNNYSSIYNLCVIVLTASVVFTIHDIINRNVESEIKLFASLILTSLVVFSVGSNNGLYTCINCLFVILPYTLSRGYTFYKSLKAQNIGTLIKLKKIGYNYLLGVFFIFCVQSLLFGTFFSFVEAKGSENLLGKVENNYVLRNVNMDKERALDIQGLNDYVLNNNLNKREVILFGNIPSIAFYLQLKPGMNCWSGLRSYEYDIMQKELSRLWSDSEKRPFVIVDTIQLEKFEPTLNEKWKLLYSYIVKNEYCVGYSNDRFEVWVNK